MPLCGLRVHPHPRQRTACQGDAAAFLQLTDSDAKAHTVTYFNRRMPDAAAFDN